MPQYQIYFDTLEGEKKYNVDISDNETLEEVLRDILVELSERGHMMRGLSTGDLKVIWGGRGGKELDLSRTLPEQGILPNEVLRVLVEIYEGGIRSLRADRIEKEWSLLGRFAKINSSQLEIVQHCVSPAEDVFLVRLHNSPGIESVKGEQILTRDAHSIRLSYPRFYPEIPIECYIDDALFHPNVKPETGFMCLWEQANPRDTVIQAIARVQAMAAYRMVNTGEAHLMNREAARWYMTIGRPRDLVPLTWEELKVFEVHNGQILWIEPGRQLRRPSGSRLIGI